MGLEQGEEPPAGVWGGHWGWRSYRLHGPAEEDEMGSEPILWLPPEPFGGFGSGEVCGLAPAAGACC